MYGMISPIRPFGSAEICSVKRQKPTMSEPVGETYSAVKVPMSGTGWTEMYVIKWFCQVGFHCMVSGLLKAHGMMRTANRWEGLWW